MIRVSEGKYRIGDTKVLIFVRVSKIVTYSSFIYALTNSIYLLMYYVVRKPELVDLIYTFRDQFGHFA